ncbi:hypothetical protein [Kitasatospora sp. NPDC059803]|uniref:hypothetical protein n=1 Tax=Kitasatospora sp. NPDC059803 TaxID=3346953 RepID=UPI0036613658
MTREYSTAGPRTIDSTPTGSDAEPAGDPQVEQVRVARASVQQGQQTTWRGSSVSNAMGWMLVRCAQSRSVASCRAWSMVVVAFRTHWLASSMGAAPACRTPASASSLSVRAALAPAWSHREVRADQLPASSAAQAFRDEIRASLK